MAESPAHKFGQIIGNLLESVIEPVLEEFASARNLYLDHQKRARSARKGKKVTWKDKYGNLHDLDFVIERGGTDDCIGVPVAFIEVAWRRYTKHSRNKAQEIQGAILPLAETYRDSKPFLGVVLSGVFTESSLAQMRSHGFNVLYISYQSILEAFACIGVDVQFDEATPDSAFKRCVKRIEGLPDKEMQKVRKRLKKANTPEISQFMAELTKCMERIPASIFIMPLFGNANEFTSIEEAIRFMDGDLDVPGKQEFCRYEITVKYSNGDRVEGSFGNKADSLAFLRFIAEQ